MIVAEIRQREKLFSLETAIDKTLDSMPNDFTLKPYLVEHKAEVKGMLLTEYNKVEQMELFK